MAYVRSGGHGGPRDGSGRKPVDGRKPNPRRERVVAAPKLKATGPAEPKKLEGLDARVLAEMLPQLAEISRSYARQQARTRANNPFQLPKFPDHVKPPAAQGGDMAMDSALVQNLDACAADWLAGDAPYGVGDRGLQFLGYPYLAELAQRPEFRVMAETIADDATRKWIDFDVTGDEKQQREAAAKDPRGEAERSTDPDERKKRVAAAGKTDKVKALQDDQLRLGVKAAFYEQSRNGSFFGRSHLFLDIWTSGSKPSDEELVTPIGDGRDETSRSKVPKGSFKGLRSIEPWTTYPQVYNALNPLEPDWYNPQQWYVMGRGVHVSRLQVFIPHPVPDMLKPAYAFGGLSLTQMAKPYVDIWLDTKQHVADLIRSFSVMILSTDLATLMNPGSAAGLIARAAMSNMLRDNQGLQLVNKNTEEFKNVSAPLGGLHELQSQAQEHCAAVHRIPLVKFTGIQPMGLNASSEGEIKVYDDTIQGYEARVFDPNLSRVINFQQLSLWGEVDPEITHRWEPLREMTQAEKGQKEKDDAERNQKYVDMSAISPAEVRQIIIKDKDLPYTGLDPDDVPEPPAEEGLIDQDGGEPDDDEQGGGANDAAIPFGVDAWNEGSHPRNKAGEFTGAGAEVALRKAVPGLAHFKHTGPQPKRTIGGHEYEADPRHWLSASTELNAAPFNTPVTIPGHKSATGIAISVDPQTKTIHFSELNSHIKGAGKAMVEALIKKYPGYKFSVTDWSRGEGGEQSFWDKVRGKHPDKFVEDSALTVDAWSEADHPRGQPGNAGQFGPGGGGGSSKSKADNKRSGERLPSHVFRGATPEREQQSTMSGGRGVYVSTDPEVAAQWGNAKQYEVKKQPRLIDLHDYDGPARNFVAKVLGMEPTDLSRDDFEDEVPTIFIQNGGIDELVDAGFDGYRLGGDAFMLGKLSDYVDPGTALEKPSKRKYGGLYKQTGKGAKADHVATVEHVLKNPPRAGVSYRELLARLVKDAPEHGGDVDQLKQHLGQAYENARQQLQVKALTAASHEESVKFDEMARRAKAKADALGFKPSAPAAHAWVDDGDPSPALKGFRERAQRDLVERGRETGKEDLEGFDLKSGKPVAYKMTAKQERSFVGFSPELEKALMDPANAIEMHHNHPGDGALSSQDLDVLQMAPGMSRVYAHGHDGSVYWASGARPGVGKAHRAAGEALYMAILSLDGVTTAERNWLHPYVVNLAVKEAGFLDELGIVPRPEMANLVARREKEIKSLVGKAVGWIERKGLKA